MEEGMQRPLRVLTLNCWNVSEPFDERTRLTRAGIEALQPDVIGLQEIIVRRDGFDQSAVLLDGLGYQTAFGAAFRWNEAGETVPADGDGDAFGNLIASRWAIRESHVLALPGAESDEHRCALAARIDAPCGSISFVTTHLNWKFDHGHIRERQALAVARFAEEWARGSAVPPLLVGDMNAEPDSTEIRFLCGLQSIDGYSTYFQDAWRIAGDGSPGYTWDNRNTYAAYVFEPSRRIDYIFVGLADMQGRGRIRSARVVMDEMSDRVFPSDHFGVLADIDV
jgi:endonuclease/exonuclease/phosphatase family metal-dependent hydrolase